MESSHLISDGHKKLSRRFRPNQLGERFGPNQLGELRTAIEPIPLRNRSPSPVPAHLGGIMPKRAGGGPPDVSHHPTGISSGPASYRNWQQQHHLRECSFSPDFRGKRPRGARSSVSPDRRNGPSSTGIPTAPLASDSNPSAKRGRHNYENNPRCPMFPLLQSPWKMGNTISRTDIDCDTEAKPAKPEVKLEEDQLIGTSPPARMDEDEDGGKAGVEAEGGGIYHGRRKSSK
ncbi:hypothetical protein PCANC_25932 [Puccinia coronata f. sp. avenae]|uniref:Uncharacterized protein n=1 Tax=Puccinia coronata f. sp. avenae TaxID=200324 RepID=A0A2N5TK13_9BASI|nr:hypothetical protein PCANC_25932 [Puccinia coronata f. sp. avenae]